MADRRESRSDILSAVVTVLSTRGADQLSIRTVAAEAGVSVGAVQHHFPTKQALLTGAMARVEERFRLRLQARFEQEPSPEARLRVFCEAIACVEDADVADAVVWTAFASRAGTDPEIRALHTAAWSHTEDVVLELLRAARPSASLSPTTPRSSSPSSTASPSPAPPSSRPASPHPRPRPDHPDSPSWRPDPPPLLARCHVRPPPPACRVPDWHLAT